MKINWQITTAFDGDTDSGATSSLVLSFSKRLALRNWAILGSAVILFATSFLLPLSSAQAEVNDSVELLNSVVPDSSDQSSLLQELRVYEANEMDIALAPTHATRFRLHLNSDHQIDRSRPVVILVHGLFNSPQWLDAQEDLNFRDGANVINLRLPGHFEKDRFSLDRVHARDWTRSLEIALRWAQQLGSSVDLVGHSLGGLLAMRLAAQVPNQIDKLILFSPALHVSLNNRVKVGVTTTIGLSSWINGTPKPNERYLSTWASKETIRLSNEFASKKMSNGSSPKYSFASAVQSLSKMKILWVDTADEQTLDLDMNRRVASQLKAINPQFDHLEYDKSLAIAHVASAQITGSVEPIIVPHYEAIMSRTIGQPLKPALESSLNPSPEAAPCAQCSN